MARVPAGTQPWADALNDDLDGIEALAQQGVNDAAAAAEAAAAGLATKASTADLAAEATARANADATKANKAGDTFTGPVKVSLSGGSPLHDLTRTDAPADARRWIWVEDASGNLQAQAVKDDGTVSRVPLILQRDGRVTFDSIPQLRGTGFPEGIVTAPVGARYIDTAATIGAVEWIKAGGTGNTGWKVASGDTGWRDIKSDAGTAWDTGLVTLDGGTVFHIRRTTNAVSIRLLIRPIAAMPSLTPIAALPAGFIPPSSPGLERFPLTNMSTQATYGGAAVISNSGGLQISCSVAGQLIGGSMTFPMSGSGWPTSLPGTAI